MPPKKVREPPLRVGDRVSIAVMQFGEEYAKGRAEAEDGSHRRWSSQELRDEGEVKEKSDGKFLVEFGSDEDARWWKRDKLRFVRRADRPVVQVEEERGSSDAESEFGPGDDASGDEEGEEDEGEEDEDESEEEDEEGDAADPTTNPADPNAAGWTRDDNCFECERAKHGYISKFEPVWNRRPASCKVGTASTDDDIDAYFFDVCRSWFDDEFVAQVADAMQQNGRLKGSDWAAWTVTVDDVYQWIGVWYYSLAFPQVGDRRQYFRGNRTSGGGLPFGPVHFLEDYLSMGGNGFKGVRWFENMLTCFSLPTGDAEESDPFFRVRHMWEVVRKTFSECVLPSWLMCLDESMVKWRGRGMPGLMVVPRKPTPMGLEIHTLCCALSGIMTNFEVYEGKEAMEKKEFVGELTEHGAINKSTALSLRCVSPYFTTVCVRSGTCIHATMFTYVCAL